MSIPTRLHYTQEVNEALADLYAKVCEAVTVGALPDGLLWWSTICPGGADGRIVIAEFRVMDVSREEVIALFSRDEGGEP